MMRIGRRDLICGGGFAALGAGAYLLRPQRAFAQLSRDAINRAIPPHIGEYRFDSSTGFILPPTDELSTKLYDQVLTRNYMAAPDQPPIMALFAYGSTQNLTLRLHRPEQCYPMQGFDLTPLQPVALRLGGYTVPADFTTAHRPGRIEQVLFWSRIGGDFAANRVEETWLITKENLRGRMPDGMLVRLSMIDPDRAGALAAMIAFAQNLAAMLPPAGHRLIFG